MSELSKNQIAVMKHTVSGPNRNWFGTDYGCKDSDDFEELVKLDLATKLEAPSWTEDDVIYSLSEKGKEVIAQYEGVTAQDLETFRGE